MKQFLLFLVSVIFIVGVVSAAIYRSQQEDEPDTIELHANRTSIQETQIETETDLDAQLSEDTEVETSIALLPRNTDMKSPQTSG